MSAGYEYGNTRLRVRKARLLSGPELGGLAASETLSRFQNTLSDLDYGPDLEAALLRYTGLRLIDSALSRNLARTLQSVRSFYGPEETAIDLLLSHWDLHNIRTILRGQARLQGPEHIRPLLVPAARLTEGELVELASQPTLRDVLDLMRAWEVPSREVALRLLREWSAFELSGNPAVLEEALHHGFASRMDSALNGADGDLSRTLRSEYDAANLLLALRFRQMRIDGEPDQMSRSNGRFLPGGRVPVARFGTIEREDERAGVAERIAETPHIPESWRVAVSSWVEHGDLVTLAEAIRLAAVQDVVSLFHRGDPLGVAIPTAYVRAKENEVRNLRLIGRGIVNRLPAAAIEEGLRVT